jgi:ABC-type branched-subunit amino acid transport system ATPase component
MKLQLSKLYAGYTEGNSILNGINLTVDEGEVLGIIGQNGSGKSTLAKAIMNLLPYVSGEIALDGKPLLCKSTNKIAEMGIGFFLQGGRIFPHLTVMENLALAAREAQKRNARDRMVGLGESFELLINGREKTQAAALSGGEKQHLALAMVLVNAPKVLILDEPSAGLSPVNAKAIYHVLAGFRETNHTTILLIEQNISMAFALSNRINLLENGVFSLEGKATADFEKKVINALFDK